VELLKAYCLPLLLYASESVSLIPSQLHEMNNCINRAVFKFFSWYGQNSGKKTYKVQDRLTDLGVYGDLFLTTSFAGSYLKLSLRHGCICVVVYGCVCNFCVCMCNCAVFDFFICHAYPAAFYAKNKLNMDRKASPEDERV